MTLYNKYRPKTFEDFVGNESAIKNLKKLLDKSEHPHVYLFSGSAGCGKTSMARVLTDYVKSDTLIELNSADNRGIDTAREIIANIQYVSASPVVYILDEVHKASNDFQNAMLKVLEDTPDNVYFVLCSSEPNKIIAAIKSRCTKIDFKNLSEDELLMLCRKVSKAEGVKCSIDVLEKVASMSNGSPREALVHLEKVLHLEPEEALASLEKESLSSATIDICRALVSRETSWRDISALISALETTDWESIRYAVLGYMSSVLLKRGDQRTARIIEMFSQPFYNNGKAGLVLASYRAIVE